MLKQKTIKFISALLLSALPISALAQVDPNFNPNKLIEDAVFSDTQTFGGPEGIQKFLESRNSILANTNPAFLAMLKEPDAILLKQGLEDPGASLGRLRTAAELIWDAARQSGLNPQVILVTLQKEQGLITNHQNTATDKLQRVLDKAMGFDCPDSGGCGNVFPGFYYQIFGNYDSEGNRYLGAAKSLMKSFSYPQGRGPLFNGRPAQVGETLMIENTTGAYTDQPSQSVQLLNQATAALYRYTPHVFNGNYNFWRYFQEWFRYPNGTIIKLASGVDSYIIQNGTKQLVPPFVAIARALNTASPTIASPTEFETYPTGKVFGPADGTIVRVIGENKQYAFIKNIKYPASDFVIGQRGLDASKALSISAQESALFEQGPVLPPSEGTILKGQSDPSVYLVENSRLKLFSGFTFSQRKLAFSKITVIPDSEVATYEKQGFVAPLDNTLVKASDSGTVFLMQNGLKHPLSAELFKNRGLSFKNVVVLTPEEVGALVIGAFATPKEITWLANSVSKQMYLFKEGSLHSISSYVAKSRKITPDYYFSPGEIGEWQESIPYPPRNGVLVKGDKEGAVYLVQNGQLKGITGTAFKRRGYSFKNVVTLPQAEVDNYAKGEVITK